jgi:hypothetical protein
LFCESDGNDFISKGCDIYGKLLCKDHLIVLEVDYDHKLFTFIVKFNSVFLANSQNCGENSLSLAYARYVSSGDA